VKRSAVILVLALLCSVPVCAFPGSKPKKNETKKGEAAPQIVDSGSFGVFVNGQRIATESFQIHQKEGYSITSSELKMEDGSKAAQEAQLEILTNGDLRKYEWQELSPTKARSVVQPSEQFLVWRYIATACGQPSQNSNCKIGKLQFGVFVPRQQTPVMVSLEYKGREKVQIRGAERELDRIDMTADGLTWSMWVDFADSYKLQRILVAGEKTEIVRD
jgi:hypothetical protein